MCGDQPSLHCCWHDEASFPGYYNTELIIQFLSHNITILMLCSKKKKYYTVSWPTKNQIIFCILCKNMIIYKYYVLPLLYNFIELFSIIFNFLIFFPMYFFGTWILNFYRVCIRLTYIFCICHLSTIAFCRKSLCSNYNIHMEHCCHAVLCQPADCVFVCFRVSWYSPAGCNYSVWWLRQYYRRKFWNDDQIHQEFDCLVLGHTSPGVYVQCVYVF